MFAAITSSPATDSARRRPDRSLALLLCRALLTLLLIAATTVDSADLPAEATDLSTADADSLTGPTPRSVLIRSALLPGWGQLYNHKPFKAAFFAATSVSLLSTSISAHRSLGDAITPLEHEDRAARRNTRLLYFALSVTFSALDAYVDAHLAHFAADKEVVSLTPRTDGALLSLHLTW